MGKVANGDEKAFEILFNKYKRPIMNFIFQMTGDKKVAEDLTQEVFLKVFKNAHQYDTSKKFTTWLWTIAKYTSIDSSRKKKDELLRDHDKQENEIPSDDHSFEENLMKETNREIIQTCISKLPLQQKEAIQLRIFSELGHAEISEITGKSEKAVKSLINRAKSSLVNCVKSKIEVDHE